MASAQDWAKAQVAGSNQHTAKATGPATLPDQTLTTVADRAAQSGASERTQRMADKVAKEAPELAVKVAHGEALRDLSKRIQDKAEQLVTTRTVTSEVTTETAYSDHAIARDRGGNRRCFAAWHRGREGGSRPPADAIG